VKLHVNDERRREGISLRCWTKRERGRSLTHRSCVEVGVVLDEREDEA
jgi:hypothetical protein